MMDIFKECERQEQAEVDAAWQRGYEDGRRLGILEGFRAGALEGAFELARALLDLRNRLALIKHHLLHSPQHQHQNRCLPRSSALQTSKAWVKLKSVEDALSRFVLKNIEDTEREFTLDQLRCKVRELEANAVLLGQTKEKVEENAGAQRAAGPSNSLSF